jgi:hypothetical protein
VSLSIEKPKSIEDQCVLLDGIYNDLHRAVALRATMLPPIYEAQISSKYDRTRSAHVFKLVRDSIQNEFIHTLSRIWDNGKAAVSILRVNNFLKTEENLNALASWKGDQARSSAGVIKTQNPEAPDDFIDILRQEAAERGDQLEQATYKDYNDFSDLMAAVMETDLFASLKNYRNEKLAHRLKFNVEIQEKRDNRCLPTVKYGGAEQLLDQTIPVVTQLHNLFGISTEHSIQNINDDWAAFSREFWNEAGPPQPIRRE